MLFVQDGNQNVYGGAYKEELEKKGKYVKVKVQSATKKGLKLKVTNTSKKILLWGSIFIKKTCKK